MLFRQRRRRCCFWDVHSPLAPWRHHYDNRQFYIRILTIGTRVRATGGEGRRGALDLLDDRHSGDPINVTLDANTMSAWRLRHFTPRANAISSKTSECGDHHPLTAERQQSASPPLSCCQIWSTQAGKLRSLKLPSLRWRRLSKQHEN